MSASPTNSRRIAVALAGLSIAAPPALAADPPHDVVTLADGVYGFVWRDPTAQPIQGNALFIVNDADVVVVDSGLLPRSARTMAAELKKITDKPVRYLVNTHWHDDHNNGNAVYRELWPGVEFVAHANTREDILAQNYGIRDESIAREEAEAKQIAQALATGKDSSDAPLEGARRARFEEYAAMFADTIPELKSVVDAPPDLTFEDALVLHRRANGAERTIEIRWLGLGNTRGDVVVILPREKIAAIGDLVVWPIPFAFGSYYEEWNKTLERVDALDVTRLFPGHGPVHENRDYLHQVQGLLRALVERVHEAVEDSATLEETTQRVKLADWRATFAGADPERQAMFDQFFLAPAVVRCFHQEKAKTQTLR